jgi:regulator of RNase E activity RraA
MVKDSFCANLRAVLNDCGLSTIRWLRILVKFPKSGNPSAVTSTRTSKDAKVRLTRILGGCIMHSRSRRLSIGIFLALGVISAFVALAKPSGTSVKQELAPAPANDDATLLDGFRHVEVASVSDALEQIAAKKMYMTHRMRPIFPTRFAGFATTVALKKEANHDPDALKGMLHAIDTAAPNSVYVMVVEDGSDIAGMGGLMGTAMSARNLAGAVIDGGVRDTAYLQKIGFPVYALGIVPSTSITHYRFAGANIPVVCDGVPVAPGDVVAADSDGVVVVPKVIAPQVLKLAQEMDFKEHSMYAYIEKLKSIEQAVAKFGRL